MNYSEKMKVTSEMTEEKARSLLGAWVKILHLEAWDIDFRWRVRAADFPPSDDGPSMGLTSWVDATSQAIIRMLDPVDFAENGHFAYDYEKTMVHELLHLKFAALDYSGDDLRDKLTHRMVDDMAKALVSAARGEVHTPEGIAIHEYGHLVSAARGEVHTANEGE